MNIFKTGQVHRLSNHVAVYIGGETVYLPVDSARKLANAILACVSDIMTHDGVNSQFPTIRI